MEDELITYETAKLAKEKGFNIKTKYRFFYNSALTTTEEYVGYKELYYAPTQSLLQKWLREKHNMLVIAKHYKDNWYEYVIQNCIITDDGRVWGKDIESDKNETTYEQALEEGLCEALKLI